jgi:hypothetical protein
MALNNGRQLQFVPGIQGVVAGGQAQVQINPNRRIFRLNFQCTGVAFVAPVLTLPASAGASVQPTFTVTVVAGKIMTVAILSATATGAANGTYTLVVTDNITVVGGTLNNNQYGAVVTAVVSGATVTSVTLVNGGNVAAVPIEIFFNGQILQTVGGVNMRDISATLIKAAAYADDVAESWQLGELMINYVRPSDRNLPSSEALVWDLWGQSILSFQMPITANITSPSMVGVYEFDQDISLRNTVQTGPTTSVPFLQPMAQHAQTFQVPASSALFSITTVPFQLSPNVPLPILRLLFAESVPGNITQIEIDQDGNKVIQLTQAEIQQMYNDYRFNTGIFGAIAIFDIDRRINRALRCQQNLVVWVASAVAQSITIVRETLPGAYSGG